MKKNLKWVSYRHPRTRAEARANQEGWERTRRRPHLLPNTYDDIYATRDKSWKQKRKTQYYPDGRGQEHSITVDDDFTYEWDLTKYFEDHDIPHSLEKITEPYTFKQMLWKYEKDTRKSPVYRHFRVKNVDGDLVWTYKIDRWEYKDHWKSIGWKWVTGYRTVAYKVTWWYDKDIGIDYILKQCRRRRLYYGS